MRLLLAMVLSSVLGACGPTSKQSDDGPHDSAAAVTADSVVALVPEREFEKAVSRGDLRPIGVCGYACLSVGIEPADRGILPTDSMIIVPGTGDAISGPGMARLNEVADTFATRYNRLLIQYLKSHPALQASGRGR